MAELRRVKVVETSIYTLILGAEWIDKGHNVLFANEGCDRLCTE